MKKIKSPHLDEKTKWLNKLKEQPLLPDLILLIHIIIFGMLDLENIM